MTLSNKQRIFIDEYLQCWNATEAARRAGYKGNDATLASVGWENLRKPEIASVIEQRLQESQMSADEALKLLADIARGDISDLMDVTSVGWSLDMKKAKERGMTKLIKKVKQTTITKIGRKQDDDDEERTYLEVELYPADAALRDILKVHEKIPSDNKIVIQVEYADRNRNNTDSA